jgi:signal transduction histidine kinase/ActR/RegA family two-component response regulator/sensor domain CHASE-containing protein
MKPDTKAKNDKPRRTWIPYFVLGISLLLTLVATSFVAATARAKDELRFENAVENAQDSINDRLETYISVLRGAAGLFAAKGELSRKEFETYVERLDLHNRYRGIQGIGFSKRVRPQERWAITEAMRRQGQGSFKIWPEQERSEYHTILYLEPMDRRNQAAIGYDMFTEPVRRSAMERARDFGIPAASGKVTLVQEIDKNKQAGFIIYVPVYRFGTIPSTIEERREVLEGFVYSPFRIDDLLTGIFGTESLPRLDFKVFDGTDLKPDSLLHDSSTFRGDSNGSYQPDFSTITTISVGGRIWSLWFGTRPEFEVASVRRFTPYTLVGGILISLLLFTATYSQARARSAAEQIAEDLRETLTQRKLAVEALRGSEGRFRTLVEQSPLSTQIFSPDGRTIQVNSAWEELWGVTLDKITDYNILEDEQLVKKGIMPYIKKAFDGEATLIPPIIYNPNETIPDMTNLKNPNRWVRAFIYPVKDEAGKVREVVLIHEDITDRKLAEEERVRLLKLEQEARLEAEEANRLKDEFLATISHELRTPLTAMLGWARMLRSDKLDKPTSGRAIEAIERNAKTQAQLIEDLLDISRIITGKLHLEVRPVDIVTVIDSAIDAVRPAADAKSIRLQTRLEPGAGLVMGDPNRLQQVVWNLLSNAIKFTPLEGSVRVSLEPVGSYLEITVVDTGQGIAPEFLPQVFERFRQGDSSITRKHGGLGLGLAIVRHLVELHGGTVNADSAGEGKGATFKVRLPIKQVQTEKDLPEGMRTRSADNALKSPTTLKNLRVLVVDDEADTRELLAAVLSSCGAEVKASSSAAEALEAMEKWHPNILVSDIGMPVENGYELIRKVRALKPEQGGQIPAIALTAYAKNEDQRQALIAGFQVHVSKPVEPAELVIVIANLAART